MSLIACFLCILLVPLATAGLALIHQGLGRSRSAAQAMLATLCALSVAAIVFVLVGASLAGFAGGASHGVVVQHLRWDWLGAEPLFAHGLRNAAGSYPALVMCLQVFTVGIVALVPVSAGNDRWRLVAVCASSVLMAGLLYPLFSHWVWGGGWLAQLDALVGLPAFVDAGGAGVVHVVGGLSALSVAWVLGPRQGKYAQSMATAIPGHNIVLVLFGCLLALVGWTGLDSAVSMLFYGAVPQQLMMVAINAMLRRGRMPGRRGHHAAALPQARRFAQRERLDRRPGRRQRRMRPAVAGQDGLRRPGCWRLGHVPGRGART